MDSSTNGDPPQDPKPRPAAGTRSRFRPWRRPVATAEDIQDRRYRRWAELWATIVLTMATLATSWAGYEAGKWSSIEGALNQRATLMVIHSGQLTIEGQEAMMIDLQVFTNWANAYKSGDTVLENFYRDRMRVEFRPAFEAWLATQPLENPDAPSSPFAMDEYHRALLDEASDRITEAGQLGLSAEVAGSFADEYTLSILILAGALLLAGLAQRFEWAELRIAVVAISLLVLLASIINIVRLPIV